MIKQRSMGVSIRAYARHRGVSDTAVRKAIATGRITLEPDGTLDIQHADAQWVRNTQQQRTGPVQAQRVGQCESTMEQTPNLSTGSVSLLQARTANEAIKVQTNKVRLSRLKGELINRHDAITQVFKLARAERDAWLNWPERICGPMAAELGIDAHALHFALEIAVRAHLQELGQIALQFETSPTNKNETT